MYRHLHNKNFTNGTFDSWMDLVTQANSSSPCESISQVIQNTTTSAVVQNTIGVITNIMGVLGGDIYLRLFQHLQFPVAEAIDNAAGEDEEGENSSSGSQSGSGNNQSGSGNNQSGTQSGGSDSKEGGNSGSGTSSGQSSGSGSSQTSGGQGNTSESGTSTGGAENGTEEESKEGAMTMSLANSVSNAIDGGDGSAEANKNFRLFNCIG